MGVSGLVSLSLTAGRMKSSVLLILTLLVFLNGRGEAAEEEGMDIITKENYDNFFHLVDSFLWDSEDSEGRMYRRGYMRMRRPRILSVYNSYGQQEPSSLYRSFVDQCYGFLCWSGLNSLADSMARLG